jgi:hypothetical protein
MNDIVDRLCGVFQALLLFLSGGVSTYGKPISKEGVNGRKWGKPTDIDIAILDGDHLAVYFVDDIIDQFASMMSTKGGGRKKRETNIGNASENISSPVRASLYKSILWVKKRGVSERRQDRLENICDTWRKLDLWGLEFVEQCFGMKWITSLSSFVSIQNLLRTNTVQNLAIGGLSKAQFSSRNTLQLPLFISPSLGHTNMQSPLPQECIYTPLALRKL